MKIVGNGAWTLLNNAVARKNPDPEQRVLLPNHASGPQRNRPCNPSSTDPRTERKLAIPEQVIGIGWF